MCVIIIAPPGVDVPLDTIDLATKKNPDWWGMSFKSQDGTLHIRRGESPRSARKAWRRAPKDVERIFHARIGTSGTKDITNTHPFECGQPGGKRRLLFHNGVVPMPEVKAQYCDSWHLAQLLRLADNKELFVALKEYAFSERSRFVVQNEDPNVETVMYGKWDKKDGAYYSNLYLFPYTTTTYTPYQPSSGPASGNTPTSKGFSKYWENGAWVETGSQKKSLFPVVTEEDEAECFGARDDDDEAAYEATWARFIREGFSVDRIGEQVDLATDASWLYPEDQRDDVYEAVYHHLNSMTPEEFEAVKEKQGYGAAALMDLVPRSS